jgi:2-amino-4-hydroxy-6-hydroxymethyldihydropteridine diphosphokinase
MVSVYVGVGSNVERETNIRSGVEALHATFGKLVISPVYESPPVGFEGAPFYNLVVGFETDLDPLAVKKRLTAIEHRNGRERTGERFIERVLDLDLLLYGDLVTQGGELELPREDIECYAFVLKPLSDIAGDLRHPVSGRRIAEMWAAFDQAGQPLQRVHFDWDPDIRHE